MIGAAKVRVALLPPGNTLFSVGVPGGPFPKPFKTTEVGVFVASLTMVTVPIRVPADVGRNDTLIVHEPPAINPEPQKLVTLKSPLAAILARLRAVVLLLVRIIDCALLTVPRFCTAKRKFVEFKKTTGIITPG